MLQPSIFRPPPPTFDEGTVADSMRRGLVSCPPDTPLRAVAEMMSGHRVHCVAVRDELAADAAVWRIVTDLDLVSAAVRSGEPRTAGEIATGPVLTIEPAASLGEAAQLMAAERVSHLVVVDPAGSRPLGVISTLDLAGALARRAA